MNVNELLNNLNNYRKFERFVFRFVLHFEILKQNVIDDLSNFRSDLAEMDNTVQK